MRNAMDAQEVAVGWWPGDPRYRKAAFYAYAHPAPEGFAAATLAAAAARWDADLGEYVLDWDDVCAARRPARVRARVRSLGASATPARSAGGTRRSRPAPRARRRRSFEPLRLTRAAGSDRTDAPTSKEAARMASSDASYGDEAILRSVVDAVALNPQPLPPEPPPE